MNRGSLFLSIGLHKTVFRSSQTEKESPSQVVIPGFFGLLHLEPLDDLRV